MNEKKITRLCFALFWYKNWRNFIAESYSSPSKHAEMIFPSTRKLEKKIKNNLIQFVKMFEF